jgi:hypothetical protein
MRLQLLAAIGLVAAEQQPLLDVLKGYLGQLTNLVPAVAPQAAPATPLEAAAKKVANLAVTNLSMANWKDTLTPAKTKTIGQSDEWLIYITGNKSCNGLCDNTTAAWNVSRSFRHSVLY